MNPATAPLETDAAALGYQSTESTPAGQPEVVSTVAPGQELLNDPGPAQTAAMPTATPPAPASAVAPIQVVAPTDPASSPNAPTVDLTAELPTAPNELEEYLYGQRP